MADRPRIGVSTCLLGERVRYDGAHKRDDWLVDVLGAHVEWVPVCPEVEAGFGVPREPIQLERADAGPAVVTVETRRDVTQIMREYAERRVGELAASGLDGYVLKAESPSCGLDKVKMFTAPGVFDRSGRGVFAERLVTALSDVPIIDEQRLSDPSERRVFLDRVFARYRERVASPVQPVSVVRVRAAARESTIDRAATEEPLEIRLHRRPFAVIMRTPGADRELAAGFLLSERVIRSADDLGTIEYCRDAEGPPEGGPYVPINVVSGFSRTNIVNVTLTRGAADIERLLADRRDVTMNASCGVCGRRTIDALAADVDPIQTTMTLLSSVLVTLPERLRASQAVFDETGGLHAAALFDRGGTLLDLAEDVGRHNAVDKIVGRMLMRERLPLSDAVLCVSGRTSFEIVQKAVVAGIPIVAAVSAPSSLAIETANQLGVTLVGFVRGDSFNVYTHTERIQIG